MYRTPADNCLGHLEKKLKNQKKRKKVVSPGTDDPVLACVNAGDETRTLQRSPEADCRNERREDAMNVKMSGIPPERILFTTVPPAPASQRRSAPIADVIIHMKSAITTNILIRVPFR